MTQHRLLPALLLLASCKVIDAPEDFESLVVYGFVHVEDQEEAPLQVFYDGVWSFEAAQREGLDAGWRVDSLTDADLALVGVQAPLAAEVLGVSTATPYRSSVAELAAQLTRPDMEVLFENVTEWTISSETDRDAFLAGEASTYSRTGTRASDLGLFGTSNQQYEQHFRWLDVGLDEPILLYHNLSPDPFDMSSSLVAIHQQYDFTVLWPDGEGSRRLETYWVDAELIGMDVPDSTMLDLAVTRMKKGQESLDAAVEGM